MGLIDGIYRYGQDRLLPLDYLFPYLTSHEVGAELVAVGLGANLSVYHVADAQQELLLEPTRLAVGDAVERGTKSVHGLLNLSLLLSFLLLVHILWFLILSRM